MAAIKCKYYSYWSDLGLLYYFGTWDGLSMLKVNSNPYTKGREGKVRYPITSWIQGREMSKIISPLNLKMPGFPKERSDKVEYQTDSEWSDMIKHLCEFHGMVVLGVLVGQ